jgi:hypothetical protein
MRLQRVDWHLTTPEQHGIASRMKQLFLLGFEEAQD